MSGLDVRVSQIVGRRWLLVAILSLAGLIVFFLTGRPGGVPEVPPGRPAALTAPALFVDPPQPGPGPSLPIHVTIQGAGPDMGAPPPGGGEVTFIVRLRNAPEVNIIARSFRRDPQTALAAWSDLTRRVPVFADFELVGASYAGEIHVAKRLPVLSEDVVRDIQARLLAIEGVVYADPDSIAHPGEKDPK